MKKFLLIGAVFLLFAGFAMAGTANLPIFKGWNLVPEGIISSTESNKQLLNYASASYIYSPLENKYVGGAMKNGQFADHFQLDQAYADNSVYNQNYFIPTSVGTSRWIYFTQSGELTLESSGSSASTAYLQKKLFKGWNFFSVPQAAIDAKSNLKSLFSNCSVLIITYWQPQYQDWYKSHDISDATNQILSESNQFSEEFLKLSFVVKVASECQLSGTSPIAPPPTLPE